MSTMTERTDPSGNPRDYDLVGPDYVWPDAAYYPPPVGAPIFGAPNWYDAPAATAPRSRRRRSRLLTFIAIAVVLMLALGVAFGRFGPFAQQDVSNASGTVTLPVPGSQGQNPALGAPPAGSSDGTGSAGGALGGLGLGGSGSTGTGSSGTGSTGTGSSSLSAAGSAAAAAVSPALVNINTKIGYSGAAAAGTGIVLTADGIVLTNHHVVAGATAISVTDVGNGKTYTGTVVGYDSSDDIAVVKLTDASGLTTASFGDSTKVAVGDTVVGVGNAGGTGGAPKAAEGQVTALHQSITAGDESGTSSENLTDLIQTNANIQPGDSGGALVNTDGKVVGVDTAASASSSSPYSTQSTTTQGFAIPINFALQVAQQIVDGKASSTIHLGATAFLGIQISGTQSGATVAGVINGTAADKAGLSAGDVITKVDGTSISTATSLTKALSGHKVGDQITLHWTSQDGSSHSATVTLGSGPVG